jgi:uncharacterized protein YjiS (DUF1127 family)
MDRPHFKEEPMTTRATTFANFAAATQTFEVGRDPLAAKRSSLQCFSEWWRRIRERRELATLSDRALADFMCNRADARAETSKWFWEA